MENDSKMTQKINRKIALLILAHDKLIDLSRVLKKLENHDVSFFIHVDAKVKINKIEKSKLAKISNCQIIEDSDRVIVNWGGRSQIDAMMVLVKYALYKSEYEFSKFGFLSGADYPIATSEEILALLNNSNSDFVRVDRIIDQENDNKITNLNLHDFSLLNHRNYSGWNSKVRYYILAIFRLIKIKTLPDNLKFVHGSQWIFLTRKTILEIVKYVDNNKWYYDLFKYSFGSDEIFFQTLAYKFSDKIAQDYSRFELDDKHKNKKYGLHYIDWDNTAGTIGGPKQISELDISSISKHKTQGALFVRKVDISDRDLLDKLDSILKK